MSYEDNQLLTRAKLLMRWTTKELDEDMSAPDLDLVISLYDLLTLQEADILAYAVGKALVGKKNDRRRSKH